MAEENCCECGRYMGGPTSTVGASSAAYTPPPAMPRANCIVCFDLLCPDCGVRNTITGQLYCEVCHEATIRSCFICKMPADPQRNVCSGCGLTYCWSHMMKNMQGTCQLCVACYARQFGHEQAARDFGHQPIPDVKPPPGQPLHGPLYKAPPHGLPVGATPNMKPPPYKAPPVLTAPPPALAGMKELPFKAAPGPTTHANGPPCKPPPGQKPPPCKGLPVYKPPPPGVFAKEVPYRALVLKVPPPYPQDRPEQAAVTPSAKAAEPSTAKASTATPFEVQLAETALLPPRTSWPKNRLHSPPRGNKASRVSVL